MFESLREKEYSSIDLMAERKKREVDYIIKVSEEYYSQIVGFLENVEGIYKERKVFNKTRKIINSIENYCRPIGVMISHGDDKNKIPGVVLGWFNTSPVIEESDVPYTLYPSEKGFEIIDGLREIQGKLPLQESVKEARERLFSSVRNRLS